MLLALMLPALASELPDPPEFERTAPSGCRGVIGIDPGDPVPGTFEGGVSVCSYVMVPVDVHADLLLWRSHAEQVRGLYLIETTELTAKMEEGFSWRDSRIEELEQPIPLMQRPNTQRVVGAIEATLAIVLGVIVVNHASDLRF